MVAKYPNSWMAHYLYILGMLLYCYQIHEWMYCKYNTGVKRELLQVLLNIQYTCSPSGVTWNLNPYFLKGLLRANDESWEMTVPGKQ
jgi:hypothetical protein